MKMNCELDYRNSEISMLANLIAENTAKEYKQFKNYLNYKTEMDFICHNINTDRFLQIILDNKDFFTELLEVIDLNMKVLQFIYTNNKEKFHPTDLKYKLNNKTITCFFNSSADDKRCKVKINYMDIIWGLLMWKSKKHIYQLIHEEILVAPIE